MNTKKLLNLINGETTSAKDMIGVEETIIFADVINDENETPVAYFITEDHRVISGIARKIIRACKMLVKLNKPTENNPVAIRFVEKPYNDEGDTALTFDIVESEVVENE